MKTPKTQLENSNETKDPKPQIADPITQSKNEAKIEGEMCI